MRKGLFAILLAVSVVVTAGIVLVVDHAVGRGRIASKEKAVVSFKKFDLSDLLKGDVELDLKTSGKVLHDARLEGIEKNTAKVRGLPLEKDVTFIGLSENTLKLGLIETNLDEEAAEQMDTAQKILVAMGLVPEEEDLKETMTDLYTEQIAGFYDPDEKYISILEGKALKDVMEEINMSHEVEHAIQDQNFDLQKAPLKSDDYNGDNDLAVQSLVEGDATDTMVEYAKKFIDPFKLQAALKEEEAAGEVSSEQLDESPLYIQKSMLFPYDEGFMFVQKLKEHGGESAVNRAFKDPPLSSEQILHPEKYYGRRDNPRKVPAPDISKEMGKGWKRLDSDTLGEFDFGVWFEQYGNKKISRKVSEGWGGNSIQYYQGPKKKFVMTIETVWDTEKDAHEFYDAYKKLLEKRFGKAASAPVESGDAYVVKAGDQYFYCGLSGDATLCVQSNDRAALEKAVAQFPRYPPPPKG